MSKTTQKYGTPTLTLATTPTLTPQLSKRAKHHRAKIESVARKQYNKPYDALNDKEKSELHYQLAIMREQQKNKKQATYGAA